MFENFFSAVDFLGNLCVVIITVYTAFLTFGRKSVRFLGYRYTGSLFYGEKVIVQLQNKSLSPISIEEVYLIWPENAMLRVKKYEVPLVVRGFETVQVEMTPVSDHLEALRKLVSSDKVVFVKFSDGNSVAVSSPKGSEGIKENLAEYKSFYKDLQMNPGEQLRKLKNLGGDYRRIMYEGTVLSDKVIYILRLYEFGQIKNIFIARNGMLSEPILGAEKSFDRLEIEDYEKLKLKLKEIFSYDSSIKYHLYKVKDVAKEKTGMMI